MKTNAINKREESIASAINIIVVEPILEDPSASNETLAAAASKAAIFSAIKESLDAFSFSLFSNSNSILC